MEDITMMKAKAFEIREACDALDDKKLLMANEYNALVKKIRVIEAEEKRNEKVQQETAETGDKD
jgi:hypothetical protein